MASYPMIVIAALALPAALVDSCLRITLPLRQSPIERKCNSETCRLPDCLCPSTSPPAGLDATDVPQMIMITFDDEMKEADLERVFSQIFPPASELTNPDGCPIRGTFYASTLHRGKQKFTDYSTLQKLYLDGHEIATHSLSHESNEYFKSINSTVWAREFADQKYLTFPRLAGIDPSTIVGARGPFLQKGADGIFEMLSRFNYTYDTSMSFGQPLYPFTLDFVVDFSARQGCNISPCPDGVYPGLWELPLTWWSGSTGDVCALLDDCKLPQSQMEAFGMLMQNFRKRYNGNRAPLMMAFHLKWFEEGAKGTLPAIASFIRTVLAMGDVYFVTAAEAVQWMRYPVSLGEIRRRGGRTPWSDASCGGPTAPAAPCTGPLRQCAYNVTMHDLNGGRPVELGFTTCGQACPRDYPWVGRPLG